MAQTPDSKVEAKFHHYAFRWKQEIGADSSLSNMTNNMNYLRVIKMGERVIPLILEDLKREIYPWFVALEALTEEDSIGHDSPGDFRAIAQSWINWGREHGYVD